MNEMFRSNSIDISGVSTTTSAVVLQCHSSMTTVWKVIFSNIRGRIL